MKNLLITVLLAIAIPSVLLAQMQSVSGLVSQDSNGEPIPGVTVIVKGTNIGTVTSFEGKYQIEAPNGGILIFSFIGMKTEELEVESPILNVALSEDIAGLDEVIVVGYGTSKKRDLTGAIVSVDGEDLKTTASSNAISGLQGRVSGLIVTESGSAGSSPQVRIRGIGTLKAGTQPLYVVDGVFTDGIDFLNPMDIESVEVLKDASSLAIFGVQGANGVIIVTTKSGVKGKLNVNYDAYIGMQSIASRDRIDLTNASEFTELFNELLLNDFIDNDNAEEYSPWVGDLLGGGTNWVDEVLRTAVITNHSLSVSSNTDNSNSLLSLGYFKQDGVHKYDSYERYNVRLKKDFTINNNIKIGSNVILTNWNRDNYTNTLANAARAVPTYLPYDDGLSDDDEMNSFEGNPGAIYTASPAIQPQVGNPVAIIELNKGTDESSGYRIIANTYAEIQFLKDFSYKATGYADISLSQGSKYSPKYRVGGIQKQEYSNFSRNTSRSKTYQVDHLVNYNKVVDVHRINAVAGLTYRETESDYFGADRDSITSEAYVDPSMWMLSTGYAGLDGNYDGYDKFSFISYFARASYAYNDKYLVNLTVRRDGSSKFGPDSRWGVFPALGLGWVASDEDFFDAIEPLSFMKLKASWGRIGNDKIGNYLYFPTIDPQGKQVVIDGEVISIPTRAYLVDPDIHWEVVEGLDLGMELKFLDDKISVDLGYYNKKTLDLLATVAAPVTSAESYAITNAGSLRNTGFETSMSWLTNIGELKLNVGANVSYLHNEVIELGNSNNDIVSSESYRTSVGESVGSMYGYIHEGIFQNQTEIDNAPTTAWETLPGDIKFKDNNGDGKIDDNDRTFIGNHLPDLTYGLNLNFAYKSFDLTVQLSGVSGVDIYTETKKPSSWATFNFHESLLNRWTGEGTSNYEPILSYRSNNYLPSSYFVESGDYFRVRSLQLGYNLPKSIIKAVGIEKARLYMNAQNPITFHKHIGWTPEVGGDVLTGGWDQGNVYPIPSVYTIGLTINF